MAAYEMTHTDKRKWLVNVALFFAPVAILYLNQVAFTIASEGHVFSVKDFIPTNFILGAMVLYVINSLIDLIKKFVQK